jgi:hypothetical protein
MNQPEDNQTAYGSADRSPDDFDAEWPEGNDDRQPGGGQSTTSRRS